MRVFTTIFLAETLPTNVRCVETNSEFDQDQDGLAEFKLALRRRIAMLEARGWFEDDRFNQE